MAQFEQEPKLEKGEKSPEVRPETEGETQEKQDAKKVAWWIEQANKIKERGKDEKGKKERQESLEKTEKLDQTRMDWWKGLDPNAEPVKSHLKQSAPIPQSEIKEAKIEQQNS